MTSKLNQISARAMILDRIEECKVAALEQFPALREDLNSMTIKFSKRGRAAGTCSFNYYTRQIELNFNMKMCILSEENFNAFKNDTVPHEVAHAIEYLILGRSGHGSHWSKLCRYLGGTGKTHHELETATKSFVYSFQDGTSVKLSTVRHNKIQKKGMIYVTQSGNKIDSTVPFVESNNA